MRTRRALALSCVFSIALSTAPNVFLPTAGVALAASDEEKAGARALAEQALQEAYPQGQYEQAINLLRRAEALVHSPTHWLYIGMAQAKLGRLVLAQEALLKAAREPLSDASPEAFRVAVTTANQELEALKPRIARVTIQLSGAEPSEATVTVDGAPVPSALVGVPMPVDPGERKFQATAPGMAPAVRNLVVTEGSNFDLELVLSPDANAASSAGESGSLTLTDSDVSDRASGSDTKQILLWSGIGGAVLGIGGLVGGYLVYKGGDDPKAKADELFNECNPRGCSQWESDTVTAWDNEADDSYIPGQIMMGAGGLFVAAGATLIVLSLLSDDAPEQQGGLRVTPWVSYNGAGFSGTF
jgi:hypothetical protein